MISISPPPFRIYLLRHAEALHAARGQGDIERPLSAYGQAEADAVARRMVEKGYRPDVILASPARRARETAEAVLRTLGGGVEMHTETALYNAGPNAYVAAISSQAKDAVMLVGHNPTIEQTLADLIGHEALLTALPDGYPTAGLAVLDADPARPAAWVLRDFLTG